MYTAVKGLVLSSMFVASAYGAMPQQAAASFSYTPKYEDVKIPIATARAAESSAKAQYHFFADKDIFKARGSLEAQVSENLHLDIGATVQVQNGESQLIPKASISYKISDRAGAKISYNEKNAPQYNNRMLRVMASIMF